MVRIAGKRNSGQTVIWVVVSGLGIALMLYAVGILLRRPSLAQQLDASYVTVDLSSGRYDVSPAVALSPRGTELFSAMVRRLKPFAAICGTYQDPDFRPLGDIVINGHVVRRGCQRQGIGFTSNGESGTSSARAGHASIGAVVVQGLRVGRGFCAAERRMWMSSATDSVPLPLQIRPGDAPWGQPGTVS